MKKTLAIAFIIIIFILACIHSARSQSLAFDGATGFGKVTRGAYGKPGVTPVVLYVDNLTNTGTGSLRAALTATSPRIVMFRVGGTIVLTSGITITSPYITIAGYTAPGGGICVRGGTISIQANNVIIRNMRVRNGVYALPDAGTDGIGISSADSVMIDHCSLTWAADEQMGINGSTSGTSKVTVQNSILGEGYIDHGFGLLVNGAVGDAQTATDVSIHRNLFISCAGRMPARVGAAGQAVTMINNLTHNWISKAAEMAEQSSGDVLYNRFKSGPNTSAGGANKAIMIRWDGTSPKSTAYLSGNVSTGTVINEEIAGAASNLASTPYYNNTVYGFTPQTNTTTLETELLPTVGPIPRDAVDTRLVSEYTSATGSIPPANASFTYPTLAAGTYPAHNNGVHLSWLVSKGYAANTTAAAALTAAYLLDPANGNTSYSITEEFINDTELYIAGSPTAGNYHFSSVSGDDARTAAEATNPSTPWRTLSKLNSFWASGALNPGDQLLLKRGETFPGFIAAGESGTSAARIFVDAYGTGADPIVTGFTTITFPTNLGGGIWESATTTALLPTLNMVTVDGVNTGMGRYPNANAADGGYLRFESFVGTTSITDNQLPASPNWTGAEVVIKPRHWLINRATITGHSGGTLSFVGDQQPGANNYGYFIQNDARTLDYLFEWYHNRSTEKLRMYFGGANPASYVIKAATIDSLLYISGRSYITVSNITFEGANGNLVKTMSGTSNITIDNCHLQFAGIDGVHIFSTMSGFRLTNSNIWDCNNTCVMATNTTGAVITDNYIRNSYMIPGMGGERDGMGYGIRIGAGGLIEYNRIINSGNNATYFSGSNTIIRNNFIDSFCIVKDDGGGINSGLTGGYVPYTGRVLANNILLHGRGNNDGTPSVEFAVHPIYLDDNLNGVLIQNNSVAYSRGGGMLLHNNRDIIVMGNTFYNNAMVQANVLDDANHIESSGLRFASNIYATTNATQSTAIFEDNADAIGTYLSSDSNVYANLLSSNTSLILSRNNLATLEYHDLASWRLRYGEDANGAYSQKVVAPYRNLVLVGSNKIPSPLQNSTFTNSGTGWTNSSFIASGSGLDGGALQITPNATNFIAVALNIGTISSGTPYILRFSVKAGVYNPQTSFGARIRGGTLQYHKVTTTRQEVEMLFQGPVTGSGTLDFYIAEGGGVFYLDNIVLTQCTATITNPDDSIRFEYNDTKVDKIVPLTGTWLDVFGNSYTSSVTITPYASKILIFDTDSISETIKQNPVLAWSPITRIFSGTPLSGTQLNATANVAGTWSYSFPVGTVLPLGTHVIAATFTPTDTANYNTVTISNTVEVYDSVTSNPINYYIINGRTIYINLP